MLTILPAFDLLPVVFSKWLFLPVSVCLSVCLFVCPPVCLSVCLFVCLSVCLPVCLSVCLSACLSACLPVCLPVCLSACLSACLSVCQSLCNTPGLESPLLFVVSFSDLTSDLAPASDGGLGRWRYTIRGNCNAFTSRALAWGPVTLCGLSPSLCFSLTDITHTNNKR